ncbi:MAG: hypothetical protein IJP48_04975 [Synergistaceae bacterium]|nr:hypothetical protein [Synergistaceae bacterium]
MLVSALWKGKLFNASLFFQRLVAKKFGRDIYIVTASDGKLHDYEPRAATLELMSREIKRYNIEGSCAELGVYRGDFARLINNYFPDRKLYLFDTFTGFDSRDANIEKSENFSEAKQDFSGTSEEFVLNKMSHPEQCIIKKGWFPDTTEGVTDKFCFVRIDADLYQPTIAGLEFFYPRLVHGGVIMIHDFNNNEYKGIRIAVKEFCDKNNTGYVCITDNCGSIVIAK